MYEIGKEYDFCGETRLVTGIDGAGYPITAPSTTLSSEVSSDKPASAMLQIQYEELKLQLEEKEREIQELKEKVGCYEPLSKTEIAAELFNFYDPLKLPNSEELRKIAEYLEYEVKEDSTKAEIVRLIRKE